MWGWWTLSCRGATRFLPTECRVLVKSPYQTRILAAPLALALMFLAAELEPGLAGTPLRGNLTAHDPGTIIKCKDKYYLFYTGQGISWKWSADKIYWNGGGSVFVNAPN